MKDRRDDDIQRFQQQNLNEIKILQENLLKIRRELEQFEIKKDQAIQSVVNSNQNELIHFKRDGFQPKR